MGEQNKAKGKNYPNVIFNLLALALLLTVIVFLQQILKKPAAVEQPEINAIAAIPSEPPPQVEQVATPPPEPAQVAAPAPEPVQVAAPVQAEPTIEIASAQTPPLPKKKSVFRAELETSPLELDDETARQRYLEENRQRPKLQADSRPRGVESDGYIPFEKR